MEKRIENDNLIICEYGADKQLRNNAQCIR